MEPFSIQVQAGDVMGALARLQAAGKDMSPAMRAISMRLLSQTEANFFAQSGPSGAWPELAASTRKRRGDAARMLQDTGHLAASITPDSGPDFAAIGTNVVYAAIHQLGGDIQREARESHVRLSETKRGQLKRQKGYANLAVFAKSSNDRARKVAYKSAAFVIHIPARPYLPVGADGKLQAGMGERITALLADYLNGAWIR